MLCLAVVVHPGLQVLYTDCDTALLPGGGAKTYVPLMMHLMAATLPMCRTWTSAVWRSRLLVSLDLQTSMNNRLQLHHKVTSCWCSDPSKAQAD
jgi:hypothetical protein